MLHTATITLIGSVLALCGAGIFQTYELLPVGFTAGAVSCALFSVAEAS